MWTTAVLISAPVLCTSAQGAGETEEALTYPPPLPSWAVLAPVCLLGYVKPLQMPRRKTATSFIINLDSFSLSPQPSWGRKQDWWLNQIIVTGGFWCPTRKRGEESSRICLTVRPSAPSPAAAVSCFYHPIQQSWDTLNCLVWMIVVLLFILNKINYFALSCRLVAFLHWPEVVLFSRLWFHLQTGHTAQSCCGRAGPWAESWPTFCPQNLGVQGERAASVGAAGCLKVLRKGLAG